MEPTSHLSRRGIFAPLWLLLLACLLPPLSALPADPLDHWSLRSPSPTGIHMLDVTFGAGKFVAVGYGGLLIYSPDGVTWKIQNSIVADHVFDVVYGNGRFLATQIRDYVVLVSPDGETWTWFASPANFEALGYADGLFLGGGWTGSEFAVFTSPDGADWTRRGRLPGQITQIIRVNGRFVATGYDGKIYSSPDLADWTIHQTDYGTWFSGLAYGNGVFVAVGAKGSVLISSNGVNWTSRVLDSRIVFTDVAYGEGRFVAVGLNGVIATSVDGRTWRFLKSPTTYHLYSVAYGDHSFLAAGEDGSIVQSDPVLRLTPVRAPFATLQLSGPRQRSVNIEAANELSSTTIWQPAATVFLDTEPVLWTDPAADHLQARFYRTSLVP